MTTIDLNVLKVSFERAWHGVGACGDPRPVQEKLLNAYAEPHRKYHTLQHLSEGLELFNEVRYLALHPFEMELGYWFHDAVYDVHRGGNEEKSARWARQELEAAQVGPSVVQEVDGLVMATAHTALVTDPDQQLLVDIDLAILGADTARFDEYEKQIRQEYAFVPEALFVEKRREILQSFAQRERIYNTEQFLKTHEAQARSNLGRVLR